MKKKVMWLLIVLVIVVVLFMDRCTPIDISTADIFRSNRVIASPSFNDSMVYDTYEIVPVQGSLPILYDSISSVFYVRNGNGLTKIDSQGKVLLSDSLAHEKITSVFHFDNFIPFVFTNKGVYDFSAEQVKYQDIAEVYNESNDLCETAFKTLFQQLYSNSEMVVYEHDNLVDHAERYPMYFYTNSQWILVYAQEGEYRFSHLNYGSLEKTIIGQIDFENFPAKFNNRKLIVLKDEKQKIYATRLLSDDDYYDTYHTQILEDRDLNYKTDNSLDVVSYKKIDYYYTGGYFTLPKWVRPSFLVEAYYKLSYEGETLYFNSKTIKYNGDRTVKENVNFFQTPKIKGYEQKIAFLFNKQEGFQLKLIRPK